MKTQKRGRSSGEEGDIGLSGLLRGSLNLLGVQIDLAKLLESPEQIQDRLDELRQRLKKAGGREVLSDEDWREGGMSVSGFIRTGGMLGEREFHLGTTGSPAGGSRRTRERKQRVGEGPLGPAPEATAEPPFDVFDEGEEIHIVADVPGAGLSDLDLKAQGRTFTLNTLPGARRSYRREVSLDSEVDGSSLRAVCRNGVLEVRLRKLGSGK